MKLKIGTRGSKLALTQTEIISRMIKEKFPELSFETKIIKTTGDKILDAPLAKIGGKGLFVKEIDEAVARGDVDFAVHSMKDVPTDLVDGIEIAASPKREPVNDVLIAREARSMDELPEGAVLGTSSLRRRAQALSTRPDLEVKDLRGNVETRIRKLNEGQYDAIIMAKAGLKRLGLLEHVTEDLPLDVFVPSVGQGAIAVVARKDSQVNEYLSAINHEETLTGVKAERAFLKRLGGGCQVPIGAYTKVGDTLSLKGVVISPDGKKKIEVTKEGAPEDAEKIGTDAAETLLKNGADLILNDK
ncbi:hydroxymethylbilane synthase [archaeon]|nr:hydroxymethylbilane synthase [archaeon]